MFFRPERLKELTVYLESSNFSQKTNTLESIRPLHCCSELFSRQKLLKILSKFRNFPTWISSTLCTKFFLQFVFMTLRRHYEISRNWKKQVSAFVAILVEVSGNEEEKGFFLHFLLVLTTRRDGGCNWYLSMFLNLLSLKSWSPWITLLAAFFVFRFFSLADFITTMRDLNLRPLCLRYKETSC